MQERSVKQVDFYWGLWVVYFSERLSSFVDIMILNSHSHKYSKTHTNMLTHTRTHTHSCTHLDWSQYPLGFIGENQTDRLDRLSTDSTIRM